MNRLLMQVTHRSMVMSYAEMTVTTAMLGGAVMESVRQILLSFPLVVFSALLPLLLIYWVLVTLRLASLELFEQDSLKGDHLASSMVALGFAGVPASVALTLLVVVAGALTLAVGLMLLGWVPLGLMRVPGGVGGLWRFFVGASPLGGRVLM